MPRVNRVKKARKDQGTCSKCGKAISAGDPYVWWKHKLAYGGLLRKRCSEQACYPRPSDLTLSEFQVRLCEITEAKDDLLHMADADSLREQAEELRTLGEEQREKRENMPEGLQDSDTGQLLEERADACESAADEWDSQADEFDSTWPEEFDEGNGEEIATAEEWEDARQDAWQEALDNCPEVEA